MKGPITGSVNKQDNSPAQLYSRIKLDLSNRRLGDSYIGPLLKTRTHRK